MRGITCTLLWVLILCLPLWAADSIVVDNKPLIQIAKSGFTALETTTDHTIYGNEAGYPAIPLMHHFFEIPVNSRIESIQVIPLNIQQQVLSQPLMPVQKAYPLSYEGTPEFIMPNEAYNQRASYPLSYLSHYGDGYCGGKHVGYVTFYTSQYEPVSRTHLHPTQFRIEITYSPYRNDPPLHSTEATDRILQSMGLNVPRTESDTTGYLLIYPEAYSTYYGPLVEWRKNQGLRVFTQTVENINASYKDIHSQQERIRTYIRDMYINHSISYVTLGADTDQIPDRKFFAFDCDFGYQEDESDIPADMYYSCLDGSFDANGNGIFGEDSDDPDYFPEVYVGRISANSAEDVTSYVNRLIEYEQGNLEDYNKSLGLSMDLWEGANSVQCQQYIEEQYFPYNYQNIILNEDENTTANALAGMNSNPNIVMHTGHANRDVMALRHGYIDNNFMTNLNNLYGGIFYSIGCWAEAIDYHSIGEKMVMTQGKGMLAFVGNSRFGWGAPIAPGFGYSEFYQKEFFRLLFHENVNHISAASALQKVPFIPYFQGTSVYKWCAYELNDSGDSYFRLFTSNPKPMQYQISNGNGMAIMCIKNDDRGIPGAIIRFTASGLTFITDADGNALIPSSLNLQSAYFTVCAEGYKAILNGVFASSSNMAITGLTFSPPVDHKLIQGNHYSGSLTFSNMRNNSRANFTIELITDTTLVSYVFQDQPINTPLVIPYNVADCSLELIVKSVAEAGQRAEGTPVPIQVKVTRNESGNVIAVTRTFDYSISSPDITAESFQIEEGQILAGNNVTCSLLFTYPVKFGLHSATLTFSSDDVTIQQDSLDISFTSIQEDALHYYALVGNYLSIPLQAQEGQILALQAKLSFIWNHQNYSYIYNFAIPIGTLHYYNDFQEPSDMTGDPEWQRVCPDPSWGEIQYLALSCRPAQYGTYTISTPNFLYRDNTKVSFLYYYKMPMYGQDGVFIKLVSGTNTENLIFLGSGGALGREGGSGYISSDWTHYELDLAALPLFTLETGDLYHIEFSFVYADTTGLNDYVHMPDVGVFIDDLVISNSESLPTGLTTYTPPCVIKVFPNPIDQFDLLKIDVLSWADTDYKVEIFNIRGQRVFQDAGFLDGPNAKRIVWNQTNENGGKVASGVYLIRTKAGNREITKKVTIIR